jgi:uncharacterized protein (TIGR03067 family)
MRLRALVIVITGFLLAADSKQAIEKELKKMQGTWRFVSIKSDGKDLEEEVVKGARLTITERRFLFRVGPDVHSGIIDLDTTKKPKTIDVTFTSGADKGKVTLGIYELKDDALKVCMGVAGATRPSNFASRPGSRHVLEVMKRDKP